MACGNQAAARAFDVIIVIDTSPGFEPGIQADSGGIESSGPIAIPINVLEFRDDGDDRGDGGRVAVDDDQLRSLSLSLRPPLLVFRPKSKAPF